MANSIEALAVNELNRQHILKGKKVAVVVAKMTVPMPLKITTGGITGTPVTLAELTGFEPIGLLRKDDGVTNSRERERTDVNAIGFAQPVRSDFDTDTFSFTMVPLETRRQTIELHLGVDLSEYALDPNTGELSFPQPSDGILRHNRYLQLAQDGVGTDRVWWGRGFSAGVVAETDDQSVGGEDPWTWPMTISSETDTDLGWGVYHYFGGPGWKKRAESMGFGDLT
jgi:hypothetical protein